MVWLLLGGYCVFDRPYPLLFVIYTTGMPQLKIMSNKMRLIQFIVFLQAALHVSGVETHHQELVQL